MRTILISVFFACLYFGGLDRAYAVDPAQIAAEEGIWIEFEAKTLEAKKSMMGDPSQALKFAKTAEALLEPVTPSRKKTNGIATAKWLQGEALFRSNHAEQAKPIVDDALALIGENDQTALHGDLLLAKGRVAQALGDVQEALGSYLKAHEIFVTVDIARKQAISLQEVGRIYTSARDFDRSLKYYEQAADAAKDDASLSMVNHNNIANAYRGLEDYENAQLHYQLALEIAEQFNSPMLNTRILNNIALAQLKNGQFDEAFSTAEQGLELSEANENSEWAPFLWRVKALVAFERGQFETAADHIARTFEGQSLETTSMPYRESHDAAYQIYSAVGQTGLALRHLEAFKRLDDEALSVAASANSALMAAQFDFANQELRIEQLRTGQLERDIAIANAKARQRTTMILGITVISAIILVSLTAGFIYMRNSRNRIAAANDELNKTNDALEKANNAKSEFLATTSHEIRTPLNGILGMTQVILSQRDVDRGVKDKLEVVQSAGNSMKAIVDDILDVAKIETGTVTLDQGPTQLVRLIGDVGTLWRETVQSKGVEFNVDLSDCPREVVTDGKRLRQIVTNLVSNAVKFTETGHVTLWAQTVETDNGVELEFSVEDTGIGIPEHEFENIFKSFHQVDGSKSRRFAGTGLGLAICRNLSRALGGDVTVRSVEDEGSTFTLRIPVEVLKAAAAPTSDGSAPKCAAEAVVYVYEPNMLQQFVLEADLKDDVDAVEVFSSVDEMLERASSNDVDVLVVDVESAGKLEIDEAGQSFVLIGYTETLDGPKPGIFDQVIVGELDGESVVAAIDACLGSASDGTSEPSKDVA